MRFGAVVPLATALAMAAGTARAQTPADAGASDAGARKDAELEASRKAMQDLEAQVIELRRIIEAMDQSRASVDDLRRRIDELEARLGENDRRDEALAHGAGGEATLLKFHDYGFTLRSPNGRFGLTPHLRLQTIYAGVLASKGTADMGVAPDQSGFTLAHTELILEGQIWTRMLAYRLQLDPAVSPTIRDAYVQIGPPHRFGVRVGQFKVPFGLQRWTYEGELEFIDISAPMAAFSLEWDTGVMLVGRPLAGRIEYQFAVVNGTAAGQPNDNIDLAYAARIVAAPFGPLTPGEGDLAWHPRPRASFGVAGYYNLVPTDILARTQLPGAAVNPNAITDQNGDGRIDNVAIWQGGAELKALWRGASLQAEYFARYEKPGGMYAARSYDGAYAQAGYFVIRGRLQVVARIGSTDVPRYGSTPAQRLLTGDHVNEQSAGVNAYVCGHRVKLQVDYTHSHATDREPGLPTVPAASGPTQNRVRAALQVGF